MAALLLLAACEKQSGGGPGEGLPMGVEATLAGAKASITTDDLQTFWLQVDCSSDAAYSYCVPVSKSATGWSADRQLLWKSETAATTYCAAFFGGHDFTRAEFASGVDLTIPANQSTQAGLNAADLLTLKATSTTYEATTGGVLPVALNHGLAKVFPKEESDNYGYRYPGPVHLEFADHMDAGVHEDMSCMLNAHAHLRASLLGASETFAVIDGVVQTGQWGYIYFVDFDDLRPRSRKCILTVIGE